MIPKINKIFQFALVDGGLLEDAKETFNSIEEIEAYTKGQDLEGDILMLIEPEKGLNPNNAVLYTHHFWRRCNLKDKLSTGEIDMEDYNNELQEVIQEEKEELKAFKDLKK